MSKKKPALDVHLVQHTHWDREWYFTSDDSRTMLYYDMKFMIDHLLTHKDKFTYDGQASIIDDFLQYAPTWITKLKAVVAAKKLYVGPFYTAVDNTAAAGESIMRNLEMGIALATSIGHSMKVGYLPDTFGHNNQIAQILQMNGLTNLSFYRGIDPTWINDQLYFWLQSPDGSTVLGHWQTHYTTRGFGPEIGANQYTKQWFEEQIVADYKKPGSFGPSVMSYSKRNYGLPIGIPVGTDQRPYSPLLAPLTAKMNQQYHNYNFINSSYEDLLTNVAEQIAKQQIKLPVVTNELRTAKTGRVHRTIASSRMDIKQHHFALEQLLINVLEPMAILCHHNNLDVPWAMIAKVWKDLHKSSAHDSYACSNEDPVNRKLKNRLINAKRIAQGLVAMLSRLYARAIVKQTKHPDQMLMLFNYKHRPYQGSYLLTTTIKHGYENGRFQIFDQTKPIKYTILHRNAQGTHSRDALTLLLHDVTLPPFGHKLFKIVEQEPVHYIVDKATKITNNIWTVTVQPDQLLFAKDGTTYNDLIQFSCDPSVGDTYDHSPLTFHDQKIMLQNWQVLERSAAMHTIKFKATGIIPTGSADWKTNTPSVAQDVVGQISLLDHKLHLHLEVVNKSANTRLSLLVKAFTTHPQWYHDQQFGIYQRHIDDPVQRTWKDRDQYGYQWQEYPTNLAPSQNFIANHDQTLTIYMQGTKEHEMIRYQNQYYFNIVLYRAFGQFGTKNVAYRPGRASGAECPAPDAQLLDVPLSYDFIIDPAQVSINDQFMNQSWIHTKNYYLPNQWGLDRTLLRWTTNLDYYDRDQNKRQFKLDLEAPFTDPQFITSAIYRRDDQTTLVRLLNVGPSLEVTPTRHQISRTMNRFSTQPLTIPQYGLVNILIGDPACK